MVGESMKPNQKKKAVGGALGKKNRTHHINSTPILRDTNSDTGSWKAPIHNKFIQLAAIAITP